MNLTPQFSDFQSLWLMGGHGPFVWTCYIVTWLALVFLVVQPVWQKKAFVKQQRALARRAPRQPTKPAEEL